MLQKRGKRMSTGVIIAISIVVLSILMLVAVGGFSYKQTKPTFHNLKDLNALINQKSKFYTREGEQLSNRVASLSHDAELIQKEIQVNTLYFQDFADKQGEFQSSIRYLQNHAADYSKGIARNIKDEVKEDGPKVLKSFKLAFKKTAQKQKARFKNKRES